MDKRWRHPGNILLSQGCLVILAVLLLSLDVCGYWIVKWFLTVSHGMGSLRDGIFLMAALYLCSIPSWIAVVALWNWLSCISKDSVFSEATVRSLRTTALCAFTVCLITFAAFFYYRPMILLSLVSGFIGAIVRTVMCAFEKALAMQDELDFTV